MSQQLFRACKIVWVTLYINANKLTLTNLTRQFDVVKVAKMGNKEARKWTPWPKLSNQIDGVFTTCLRLYSNKYVRNTTGCIHIYCNLCF